MFLIGARIFIYTFSLILGIGGIWAGEQSVCYLEGARNLRAWKGGCRRERLQPGGLFLLPWRTLGKSRKALEGG